MHDFIEVALRRATGVTELGSSESGGSVGSYRHPDDARPVRSNLHGPSRWPQRGARGGGHVGPAFTVR